MNLKGQRNTDLKESFFKINFYTTVGQGKGTSKGEKQTLGPTNGQKQLQLNWGHETPQVLKKVSVSQCHTIPSSAQTHHCLASHVGPV